MLLLLLLMVALLVLLLFVCTAFLVRGATDAAHDDDEDGDDDEEEELAKHGAVEWVHSSSSPGKPFVYVKSVEVYHRGILKSGGGCDRGRDEISRMNVSVRFFVSCGEKRFFGFPPSPSMRGRCSPSLPSGIGLVGVPGGAGIPLLSFLNTGRCSETPSLFELAGSEGVPVEGRERRLFSQAQGRMGSPPVAPPPEEVCQRTDRSAWQRLSKKTDDQNRQKPPHLF